MTSRLADSVFLFMGPHQSPFVSQRIASFHSPGICQLKWDGFLLKGIKHSRCFIPTKKTKFIQAVAIPVAPSSLDSAEYRKQLAESYGFKQIGEPRPENVTLRNVIESLPKKVFEIDDVKAWSMGMDRDCNHRGHDCAHKSFSKNKLVEDIVGTLVFLPLIYPYEPWRFKHDKHHAKTNMSI